MSQSRYHLPPLDQLEAFEASARHLSFTRAAEELCLTQSAVSRQIAALEEHYGLPLFRRLHRALRLTDEGQRLHLTVTDVLGRLHDAGAQLQRQRAPRTVVVTTTPGFAGLWLIPRLPRFTAGRPDVDVRISASYDMVDLQRDGFDAAIRYTDAARAGPSAQLLFDEVVFPVCSPRLLQDPKRPLRQPDDLHRHALLQKESDAIDSPHDWSTWLRAMRLEGMRPASTLRFTLYDQLIQAAVDGQGIALARSPLVDDLLRQGKLAAPFAGVVASSRSYFVVPTAAGARKPEMQEFIAWLHDEVARRAQPAVDASAA